MAWTPHWTPGAWDDIKNRGADLQNKLLSAVRAFAAGDVSAFVPDGPGKATGRIRVDVYEIDVARIDRHDFQNEDGEDITILDAIVVLSVVAVPPTP